MSKQTVIILLFAWICSFALEIADGGKSDYVIVRKNNAPSPNNGNMPATS